MCKLLCIRFSTTLITGRIGKLVLKSGLKERNALLQGKSLPNATKPHLHDRFYQNQEIQEKQYFLVTLVLEILNGSTACTRQETTEGSENPPKLTIDVEVDGEDDRRM